MSVALGRMNIPASMIMSLWGELMSLFPWLYHVILVIVDVPVSWMLCVVLGRVEVPVSMVVSCYYGDS